MVWALQLVRVYGSSLVRYDKPLHGHDRRHYYRAVCDEPRCGVSDAGDDVVGVGASHMLVCLIKVLDFLNFLKIIFIISTSKH